VFGLGETPYDLTFRLFGIHVRVQPIFWIMAAVISWPLLDYGILYLLLGVACIFFSILLHEFGHVFAGLSFGARGHIVLWGFGGLAIGSANVNARWKRIVVSLAGPGIQLAFWALLFFALKYVPSIGEAVISSLFLAVLISELLWINLYWPILNLLPIWPLDGGWVIRDVFGYFSRRHAIRYSLQVSIGASILLAAYALLAPRLTFRIPYMPVGTEMAIFFAIFLFLGVQALQAETARSRDWDPWDHEGL
jgi:stage IV sporulation protein FB